MDGGDVLNTGRHMFVGISKRTNKNGTNVLKEVFSDVIPIKVIDFTGVKLRLHLKGVVTMVDEHNLMISDSEVGKFV